MLMPNLHYMNVLVLFSCTGFTGGSTRLKMTVSRDLMISSYQNSFSKSLFKTLFHNS